MRPKLEENKNLTQTSLYLDSGLIRTTKIISLYEGRSMSKLVSKLLEQYIINYEKKNGKLR